MATDTRKNGQVCAVNFTTRHEQAGETAEYQLQQMGHVVQVNGNYYIQVDIQDEEGGVTPTTFKFSKEGNVTIIRSGQFGSRMRFNASKKTSMRYQTEHGSLLVDIDTKNIIINYQNRPFSGKIYIEYDLYTGRQLIGSYELDLQFTV